MTFGLKSLLILVAVVCAVVAAACVAFPDPPKFEEAVYALAAGLWLVAGAHFVKE